MSNKTDLQEYWKKNLIILLSLLAVWFLVSNVFSIFFVEQLNQIRMGGFKLGFWFAQQGSIYVFIGIIFAYAYLMNRLDIEYDVDEK